MSEKSDLTKVTTPKDLTDEQCTAVLERLSRNLAGFRNQAELAASTEADLAGSRRASHLRDHFVQVMNEWAQETLKNIWLACREPGGEPPELDEYSDTSTSYLPPLPENELLLPLFNTILLLHVTSNNEYSSRTRTFLFSVFQVDEEVVAATLKNPKRALEQAQMKTDAAKEEVARKSKIMRMVGMGTGAIVGGVLVGVTGGLAAPAIGAGVSTILGWLGVGGTAAGILATGLASSSVVCGTLFGAYGSNRTAKIVGEYTREVEDLAIKPVHEPRETMAVRLCVTGWLESPDDVTAPWTVFGGGEDTFALQWEVQALQNLSSALVDLIKAQAMQYVKAQIIKQTVLASLFAALSPIAWLKLTKIIDNPWITAKSLATKTGRVLGTLLASRVLGARPITLVGYSLGSIVIFEALQHLATLPPSETLGLVQDVYLFGSPLPTDRAQWAAVRRVAAGRVVNGYCKDDYVLAVLARLSGMNWGVAGLAPVELQGVENVACDEVDGHLKWRGLIGKCLAQCDASGVDHMRVKEQIDRKATEISKEVNMNAEEVDRVVQAGPDS